MYKFPCYIGPLFKDSEIAYDERPDNVLYFVAKDSKIYLFDYIDNIDSVYEDRLAKVRDLCNYYDRTKVTDLPMERVEDLGQLMKVQKNYLTLGYEGAIIYNAYETGAFSTLKFKE